MAGSGWWGSLNAHVIFNCREDLLQCSRAGLGTLLGERERARGDAQLKAQGAAWRDTHTHTHICVSLNAFRSNKKMKQNMNRNNNNKNKNKSNYTHDAHNAAKKSKAKGNDNGINQGAIIKQRAASAAAELS